MRLHAQFVRTVSSWLMETAEVALLLALVAMLPISLNALPVPVDFLSSNQNASPALPIASPAITTPVQSVSLE